MVPRSWFVDGEQEWARIKMGSAEIGFRSRRFTALRFARLLKKGWASFGHLVKRILNIGACKKRENCLALVWKMVPILGMSSMLLLTVMGRKVDDRG